MGYVDSDLLPLALHMRLTMETPQDHAEFHQLARGWLEAASTSLAGDKFDALTAAPPLPSRSLTRHVGAVGEPGTLWGGLEVEPENRRRSGSLYAWSPSSWRRFLDRHLADRPRGANVLLTQLNNRGTPGAGEILEFDVSYGILGDRWTDLSANRQHPTDDAQSWESAAQQWARFYCDFVDSIDAVPAFGCVADDMQTEFSTPFETAGRFLTEETLDAGLLRGYSWITTLGTPVIELVGGVEALENSGAFHTVHAHPNGAITVQATQYLRDYDESACRRVFEALAPALPAGQPIEDRSDPVKLVYLDAANFGAHPK